MGNCIYTGQAAGFTAHAQGLAMQPLQMNALWIGDRLAKLQQLCLLSAVHAGHRVRLFTYGKLEDVPGELEQVDARDIYPESAIIRHARTGSPSIFADRFRYEIARRGLGAWADADVLFLKPLLEESDMICGWESRSRVGNSVLYFTPQSGVLQDLCRFAADDYPIPPWYNPMRRVWLGLCKRMGSPVPVSRLTWGVLGPGLLTYVLTERRELSRVWPMHRLYAVPYREKFGPFRAAYDLSARIKPDTVCVHLWAQGLHGGTTARRARPLPMAEPGSLVATMAEKIGLAL